jgi:uncharacterized protein with ParB-like and HNH nuclease domain/alkylated DNA nucleotide flippase Atl1
MEVGESTLKKLIEGEKQFQVPLYQRQYSWQTPELAQLWDDILEQYDLLTPDGEGQTHLDAPSHFIGSMVLAPSPMMQAHGVTPFLVIDGQQRLSSLLLALCAVRDEAATHEPSVVERFNERYLINKYGEGQSYYRLLPTQADRRAFFDCVEPSGEPKRNDLVSRAYAFFRGKLTQPGPDGGPLDLNRLEGVLRERLQFVAITCGKNDNVHRIFESLNDRGVRLTQADLLRNYVFMLLPTKAEEVYAKVWLPMQKSLTPRQLEILVFVDLIVRGNATVKRPDIYRAQQERLEPKERDEEAIEAEVRELARRSRLFKLMVDPQSETDPGIRPALERLEAWGAQTAYPLLLYLMDLRSRGECSDQEISEALAYVESFLVRRMVAGVPTNNLNRIFNGLIPQLPTNLPIAEAVRHALSGERKFWATDRRFREAIRTRPFYFQGRPQQRMHVFRRLEESYEHAEPVDWGAAELSIEHVMPQSLTEEWREALAAAGDDPDIVHEELLHTLGNLTVTAYNGQLSNHPFERKKQILMGSHLELNRHIIPSESWTREQILARADELAERAIKIWPGPLAGVEEPEEGRDWSRLHAALAALPPGTWTSYSDLAELIASHQVPVGQHLANTPDLPNAYRVLTTKGRVSPNFRWLDPSDKRDPREVLEAEGVTFDADGRADPEQRLNATDLAELIGEIIEPGPPEEEREFGWRIVRLLRYLRHFHEAPDGRIPEDVARHLAIKEGYDPRGIAGFYQGDKARLRVEGKYRVLTEAGREYYEANRYRINE